MLARIEHQCNILPLGRPAKPDPLFHIYFRTIIALNILLHAQHVPLVVGPTSLGAAVETQYDWLHFLVKFPGYFLYCWPRSGCIPGWQILI